jgi:hypothetical protein
MVSEHVGLLRRARWSVRERHFEEFVLGLMDARVGCFVGPRLPRRYKQVTKAERGGGVSNRAIQKQSSRLQTADDPSQIVKFSDSSEAAVWAVDTTAQSNSLRQEIHTFWQTLLSLRREFDSSFQSFNLFFLPTGRRRVWGMRPSMSFGGSQVMGEPMFPADFFAALANGEEGGAFASVRREAILPDGQPSPRVVELGGEWDTSVVVSLCMLDEGCCAGSVGGKDRFCGKARATCNIDKHKRSTTRMVHCGWQLLTGYYWSPCLPTEEDGGPITAGGAAFLNEADPFRMSRGQWILVMKAWLAQQARATPHERGGIEESKDAVVDTPSTLGMGDAIDPLAAFRANLPPIDTEGAGVIGMGNGASRGPLRRSVLRVASKCHASRAQGRTAAPPCHKGMLSFYQAITLHWISPLMFNKR